MKLTKRKTLIFIVCIFLGSFILLLTQINSETLVAFDEAVYNLLEHNSRLTSIMKFITFFGDSQTLIMLAIVAFIAIRNKKEAATVPLNLALIATCNATLKLLIKRPRPVGISLIEASGYSFPSGHSASSFAFYGFLMYLIYNNCKNQKLKIVSMMFLGILIFLIGLSRIYLGVHYASDVLGGYSLAALYLILYISTIKKYKLTK